MKLNDIQEGDLLYYTERAAGPQYDYADYLAVATMKDGELHPEPIVYNCASKGGYRLWSDLTERERRESSTMPISSCFCESDWHPAKEAAQESDKLKWMNETHPLSNDKSESSAVAD